MRRNYNNSFFPLFSSFHSKQTVCSKRRIFIWSKNDLTWKISLFDTISDVIGCSICEVEIEHSFPWFFYRFWASLLFRPNFISIMSCYKSPIHSLQLKLLWLSTNDSRFIAAKKAADELEPQGKCTNIKFLFS